MCGTCHEYLVGHDRGVLVADPATVHSAPTFAVRLPERFVWPPGCCVCGQPPTRMVEVSTRYTHTGRNVALFAAGLAAGRLIVRTGGGASYSVDVPHCTQHDDGARLEATTVSGVRLLLRSLPYQRAFRRANAVA